MAEIKNLPYVSLADALSRTLSAHRAVREGTATHAEKEKNRREEMNHKAKMAQPVERITAYDAPGISAENT